MKFTLSWLREHLETEADLHAIAERLTAIGLEVESLEDPAAVLAPFRIARVVKAERHPGADRLQLLTVDPGGGGPVQLVCGAANAHEGMIGVFAPPGAYIPGSGITLEVATIRGVESRGMMCSVRELGLGDDHEGVIALPADAPVGASYAGWAGLDDPVIEVNVTPNRQDCMGVHGIARDLAASGLGTLKPLAIPDIKGDFPCPIEIRSDDPEQCPAFFGRVVRGVSNGASPDWLQRRLKAIGQRPISALVDMTNFITIAFGRPLHVYDLAKLEGALVARRARDGEAVEALNGKTYRMDGTMTVIADDAGIHDIGGIMGGAESGVIADTRDIVIESAFFDPESIARTGRRLGLVSDARTRFERGVDPAFVAPGLALATEMAIALAGGSPSHPVLAGAPPLGKRSVSYRPGAAFALGGVDVTEDAQRAILERLGFGVEAGGVAWRITVPSWRRDVDGGADIVEEIARIHGFEHIERAALTRPAGVARPTATPAQKIERRVRRAAAARGLDEAITWSFIPGNEAEAFGGAPWRLANPISEEMKAMRPSILPGLLAAARRNLARGSTGVRLFEIGRRYLAEGERPTLGLVLAGARGARHWRDGRAEGVDAHDAKAEILALLEAGGAPSANLRIDTDAGPAFHPGRSARLSLGKALLAVAGELHPSLLRSFDLDGPVMAAELYLDALPTRRTSGHARPAFAPPTLQAVRRDFAFLVPAALPAGDLLRAARGADPAIVETNLFDVFTGGGIAEGEKSLAIEVAIQPTRRSFTEAELKAISDKIVAVAANLKARLRT